LQYGRGLWRSDMFGDYQIWFGSKVKSLPGPACPVTFRDSSTTNYINRNWYINNILAGTGIELSTNINCTATINEWSWIRLDKQLPTGEWISQKRRAGEMFKMGSVICDCALPRISNPIITDKDFTIYPNPNNGNELSIKIDSRLFAEDEADKTEKHLTIYNMQGQIVFYKKLNALTETVELETALTNGFYFVEFRGGTVRLTEKLTIIK
jgi:Secretion system C-terminal sorting domain